MIPNIIHYCWFGGKPKPEIIEKCITSWKYYCPDWEIIEWNESNYNVNSIPYMAEAYAAKKWAFVSDVARLDIVYNHGGIYLDTDVELLAPIDTLLQQDAFYFWETERNINTGMGFGAIPKHPTVEAMLQFYQGRAFLHNGKPDMTPCPAGNTESLCSVCTALKRNGCCQQLDNVLILGLGDYAKYMKHYGTASWTDTPNLGGNHTHIYKNTKLKRFLKQPEKFDFVERHFGRRGIVVYTFLVYDLPEMSVSYIMRRLINKLVKNGNDM